MNWRIVIIICCCIILISLGALGGIWYTEIYQGYDGCYYSTKTGGDWVCVNVDNMDYPRAYEVCVHECSHKAFSEIFAEGCEGNYSTCMDIITKLEEK